MAPPQTASILHQLRQTLLRQDGAGLTDGQLLRSFLHQRNEAAFEALVRRHGPMVRGVCRRILRNAHDADDAFQAAFLVLLRKASALELREVLGDWLHGVAYRTALKARTSEARRRMKEKQAPRREAIVEQEDSPDWLPLLDQEIGRLPEKYRLPVVLCDLQGRTRKEAAQQLGWPEGTLSGRLSRARAMLARRLTRRGVTLSAGAVTMGLASEASARLPFSLVGSTCKAAMGFAVGSAAGVVPVHIAALTEGVVKAMFLSKLKNVFALGMVALVLTSGVGAWRYAAVVGQEEKRPQEIRPNPVPLPAAPRVAEEQAPKLAPPVPVLPASRAFQIDLQIVELKDDERKLLANPRLLALEGTPASFASGEHRSIALGGGKKEKVVIGPAVRVIVRSNKGDKITLDVTVSRPTRAIFADGVILETKTIRHLTDTTLGSRCTFAVGDEDSTLLEVSVGVQAAKPDPEGKAIAAAERELKCAEFWQRTGHPISAYFYYESLFYSYPNTLYAERAKERMTELEKLAELQKLKKQREKLQNKPAQGEGKPPARVGMIFIVGNKKISDEDILKRIALYPGQILSYPDLRLAEKNLSRLKGLKSNPEVSVIDREDKGVFKDIRITVDEK